MQEHKNIHMEITQKILRRSIYTFLQYYQYFTTFPVLLILPFSASVLLSRTLSSSSSSPPFLIIQALFKPFFHTTELSLSSRFLSLLNTGLYPTILTSVFSLFFSLTTLLIAKIFIIQALIHPQKSSPALPFSSFKSLFQPLLITQLFNSLLLILINTTPFFLISLICHILKSSKISPNSPLVLLLSKSIFYSILGIARIVFHLALIVAGMENCMGFSAIHKAYLLSWNRNSTFISMILPINLGIFAVEGLFRYRVVKAYYEKGFFGASMAMEGVLIAYLYSILVVLDTIASCIFFKSCKANNQADYGGGYSYYYLIKVVEKEDGKLLANSEVSELLP